MKCSTSSCGSGCSTPTPCPCPPEGNPALDTLRKVVNCYWARHQGLAVERTWFAGLASLSEAIVEAAQALADENAAYHEPDRLPPASLREAHTRLLAAESAISACADFDTLHRLVAEALGPLAGITPALVYLTALRIGHQTNLVPERIYLEAGARDGAAAVAAIDSGASTMARERLPAIFRHPDLPAEEVQGCLCVCRHQLRWLADAGRMR